MGETTAQTVENMIEGAEARPWTTTMKRTAQGDVLRVRGRCRNGHLRRSNGQPRLTEPTLTLWKDLDTSLDERAFKILVRILDNLVMATRLLDDILDYRLVALKTRRMSSRAIMAMGSRAIQDMVKVTEGMATATNRARITGVVEVEAIR